MRCGRRMAVRRAAPDYWLQAEQEIVTQSVAGEEDPLAGIDQETSRG